jgi:hypothetical protein
MGAGGDVAMLAPAVLDALRETRRAALSPAPAAPASAIPGVDHAQGAESP